MSGFRRIVMSSLLMLLLPFPAADGEDYILTVRAGDEVTLPCYNVIPDQDKCESTTWTFLDLLGSGGPSVKLLEDGQIHKEAKAKSDRLRVTEKCTLVIKKVTEEDAGYYICRQVRSGEQEGPVSHVLLSVVSMTEHQDNDEVTLRCSVSTHGRCDLSAKWLLQGRDVDRDHREINTSQSLCSASVTFQTSLFSNTTRSELFTCEVTDGFTGEVHLFPLSAQSSGEDAGEVTTVSPTWTTVRMRAAGETTNTASEDNQTEQEDNNEGLLRLILVSVGLAALIITVVTVNIWTRAKGSKAQTEENMEQNDEDEDEVDYENDGGASASV